MARSQNLGTLVTLAIVATLLGYATAATYTVGDGAGWTFNPTGSLYSTWASQHNFVVGDVLVFNFTTGFHAVATVSKASFDSCNIRNPIALATNGPASITLSSPGELHFICPVGQHCATASQKLAINVTASSASPPSSPAPSIEPTPSPAPSIEPTPSPPIPSPLPETPSTGTTHIVGGSRGWTFDPNATYPIWASQQNFTVGDVLVFNFVTGSHAVATVTKESFDTCNKTSPIALTTTGPASITLTSPGETYFICIVGQHCASASQKLAINVTASSAGGNTPSAPPPSAASRTGLVSLFTIFISGAVYLLF